LSVRIHRRKAAVALSGALVATAIVLAVVGGQSGASRGIDTTARIVDRSDLVELEGSLGHQLYWAGARPSRQLELRQEADGSVYLRYLPPGSEPGESPAAFLTVGTYPVPDAQAALRRVAAESGGTTSRVAGGGIVVDDPKAQGSVYLAYPGSDLEIEVYDPTPGRSLRLIHSGAIQPLGEG
jgi:hypothetical protein